jgi:hypothetical protein
MIWALLACAPPVEAPPALDSATPTSHEPPTVQLGAEFTLDVPRASHPRVAAHPDGAVQLVFDGGLPPTAWSVPLACDGPVAIPMALVDRVDGFSTPDLAPVDTGFFVSARLGPRVGRLDEPTGRLLPQGDAPPLTFVSAPRIVHTPQGTGVAWWSTQPGDDDGYWLVWEGLDGRPSDPVQVAAADGIGSPVAVASDEQGWWLAFTRGDTVQLARGLGEELSTPFRVDSGGLARPERPALALLPSGALAVGWRAQDDAQQGAGVRWRLWDPRGVPLTDERVLGLAPDQANRIVLAATDGLLAAAWDEGAGDEGDVAVQLFDPGDGTPLTGPMVVHDRRDGTQQRPALAATTTSDEAHVYVIYEDEGLLSGRCLSIPLPL